MHASSHFALFLVRIGFGLFLLVWGLNKLVNPQATARIFENFYGWADLGTSLSYAFGLLQIVLALAIMAALFKTLAYALGVLVHGFSTYSTLPHLLLPLAEGSNLIFFAAVPVLLSAIGLFLARDADTVLSLDAWRSTAYARSDGRAGY